MKRRNSESDDVSMEFQIGQVDSSTCTYIVYMSMVAVLMLSFFILLKRQQFIYVNDSLQI